MYNPGCIQIVASPGAGTLDQDDCPGTCRKGEPKLNVSISQVLINLYKVVTYFVFTLITGSRNDQNKIVNNRNRLKIFFVLPIDLTIWSHGHFFS